ncbi:MAG TPA: Trp biosynthesis-associated membrane protein [Egibacteraceae bacterium]|nr:Trp biosynthesis-associated membrane protein [Egibacteraceae bacterium]
MSRRTPLAAALAVVGGLVLAGATTGDWVVADRVREVGGVALVDPRATPGVAMAPQAVAAGVLGTFAGLALAVARGRGRRLVGALLVIVGVGGGAVLAAGVTRAAREPGDLTAAPWIAAAGAAALVAAGVVAWRRPAPPPALGKRYSLEGAEDDDEWELAEGQ